MTDEVYLAAMRQYGIGLQWIPVDKITPEMCIAAVNENPSAVRFVPQHMKKVGRVARCCLGLA